MLHTIATCQKKKYQKRTSFSYSKWFTLHCIRKVPLNAKGILDQFSSLLDSSKIVFLLTSQGICVLRHYNYFWCYNQYVNVGIFYDQEWCTHVIISSLQVCIIWFSVLAIICVCLSLLFLNILHFQRIVQVIKDT